MWFKRKKDYNIYFEDVLSDNFGSKNVLSDTFDKTIKMRISNNSIYFIVSIVFAFSMFVVYRAYSFQILDYQVYKNKSLNNNFVAVPIPSVRGSISDVRGEFLAKTVKINSEEIDGFKRVYTEKEGFGNILGFVSYPKKDLSGKFWQDNFEGVEGLELYYNQLLSGKSGVRLYEKNASGAKRDSFVSENPLNGKDIKVSIDGELQEFIYKKTKEFVEKNNLDGASGAIMDIETGSLLSLVSYPTYDSNLLLPRDEDFIVSTTTEISRNEYYKKLTEDKRKPFLNRPISGAYAPGSIVKPLFALAALNTNTIDPNTSIFSSGKIEVQSSLPGGKPAIFRDWKAHGYTNIAEAIAVSSDVFFYSVVGGYGGQKGTGIKVIDEYSKSFGFADTTGVDLYGEKTGNIPTPEWKQKIFSEDWRLGDTYNSSIGQFGFTATPIAMTRIIAAIANSGYLVTPKILVENSSNIKQKVNIEIPEKWYELVRKGMRMAVTNGTATNLNLPYVKIAAKTGTAEIGNTKSYVHTWITGFFPYEKPKYAFVFIAEKGSRDKPKNPSAIMRQTFDWMLVNRPEYLGIDKEAAKIKIEEATTSAENINTNDAGETR